MVRKRSFKKLREHLTSNKVDEKITYLESQMPTNNTAFVFGGDPGNPQGNSFETIVDGETDSTDYSVGESPTSYTEARDTSGLFTPGGDHSKGEYVKTEEPPGDTSYILGPMAAMYYTWSYPWTMIGYIRESDRRMVNLARIDGKLSDWDQSSGFSSYGQITLEQAKWFYGIAKANGNTNDPATYSYRAYYPGPPSAVADAYGRYPCILTGVSKRTPRSVPNATPLDKQGGDNYSAMQAQQQGSGFMSFKPDLEWFKKNKKKPKGAPSDWNNMSDDEKANWISQNQPEERFDYQDGRFRPNQNNAQSNRVVNPFSIFDPSQDPLGNIPISQQFNQNLNINDPNQYNFNQTTTTTTGSARPSPDDVKAAVGHGLSKGRAESMSSSEIKKFVAQQNALQKDIDKHSADQQRYEREARNIAIGLGVDVALLFAGGPILKGIAKGIGLAAKGISALNKANKIKKVASAIQKAEKISKAAAVAKATSAVNKAEKVNKAAKATEKAIKAAKTSQKASLAKTTKLKVAPQTPTGKPNFKPGPLTGKSPTTGKPLRVSPQTPTGKPNFKPGPLTGRSIPKPVTSRTTGTTTRVTTGTPKSTSITQPVPKSQIPKKGPDGKFNINDLNIKDAKGNVTAKVVKNPKTGQWERINKPGKGASGSDLAKWERLEGQVSNKAWDAYTKTGLLNPSPIGNPLSAMNPFTPQGLRSGPTALAKKFGIPAGIGAGVGAYKGTEALQKGIASFNPEDAKQFVSNIKGGIENIISKAPSAEQATNGAIQLVSQILPQDIRTPARMFLGYLSGSIKGNAGDIIPEADQESAWKGMKINKGGGITVGGPMVNVFGGEPADSLTIDGDDAVFKFNFAPRSNEEEFKGAGADRWSPGYKSILSKLEPLTQYAADLSPNFGKTAGDKAIGLAAGAATNVFKQIDKITPDGSKLLGGIKSARDLNGSIKIPMKELKSLNPTAYNYLNKQGSANTKNISSTNLPTNQPAPSNPNKEQTKKSGGITLKWVPGEPKRGIPGAWTDITDYPKDTGYQNYADYMKGRGVKKESVSLERKREIFGHLTQPVILPETKQKTYKVSPGQRYKNKNKKPEKTNFQDMDKLFNKYDNAPQPFKPQERTSWTKDFIRQNTMQSQEKMNNVLELIGDGKFALQHAMNDYKKMGAKELEQYWGRNPYLYDFYFNNKNYKVTRKEQVEGDFIVFLEDQKGEKINILQSELNEKIQEDKERWLEELYQRDNPVVTEKGETMFDTIKRRFMEKKDIAPEFPEKAPPKMINGFHPEYGKRANRYKKLDPASANAMPLTGDPETDEIVRKQKTINKIKSMRKKA